MKDDFPLEDFADITGAVDNGSRNPEDQEDPSAMGTPEEMHPALALLDMAIQQACTYSATNNLPEPNLGVYEGFSKPFLNQALWYYCPDGNAPESPQVALLLGVAGLGLCVTPTLIAAYKKSKEETEKEEKKPPARPPAPPLPEGVLLSKHIVRQSEQPPAPPAPKPAPTLSEKINRVSDKMNAEAAPLVGFN